MCSLINLTVHFEKSQPKRLHFFHHEVADNREQILISQEILEELPQTEKD